MKGLKSICKRTAALVMALVMCLTLVPDVTIFAADEDAYTVNLSDCEGGRIAFSDDDGSVSKSFAAGSTVSVQLISDDGYKVAGFGIYESGSGEELYLTETTDDIFEFTMLDESVTLKADFAQVGENTTDDADTESSETESADAAKEADGADDTVVVKTEGVTFVGHKTPKGKFVEAMNSMLTSLGLNKGETGQTLQGVNVCADLVMKAIKNSGYCTENFNTSNAREVVNHLMITHRGLWQIVYPSINVTVAGTVELYPGDIIYQTPVDVSKSAADLRDNGIAMPDPGTTTAHIMYVYDVDDSDVWVASNAGSANRSAVYPLNKYDLSFNVVVAAENGGDIVLEEIEDTEGLTEGEDYFSVSEETFDSVSEQIESGELSNMDDIEIALQSGGGYPYMTVLRAQAPSTSSFVISKNDGSVGNEYATATYENAALKSTGKVSCSYIAASNPNYGALADARFRAKKIDGSSVNIYTDPECTVLYTDALVAGVTYYVTGDVDKLDVNEETAPKGWTLDTGAKRVTLSHNAAVPDTVSFSDEFYGDPLDLILTKTGSEGTNLSGAQFTLTNTDTGESWVYRTGSDGKIKFNDASYLVSGTVTIDNGEIKFFAGNYTLEETAAPSGYLISGGYSLHDSVYVYANYNSFWEGYKWNIKITSEDGNAQSNINGVNITNDAGMELAIKERAKLAGFELQKENKDTGINKTLYGIVCPVNVVETRLDYGIMSKSMNAATEEHCM